MLTLWGRERGLCVKKVLWCLAELKLDFKRIDAGKQYGVTDTEEYLKMNQNGLVPTLKDDDFVLWESNAIMRYLALEYGDDALYPSAPRQHGDVNRWLDWQNGALWPDISAAFVQLIRTPAAQRNHDLVKSASARLAKNWAIADAYLENRQFLAGADFTLADIALGVMAETWIYLDLPDKPALPHFAAWYARLQARPGFRQYVNVPPEADPRQKAN